MQHLPVDPSIHTNRHVTLLLPPLDELLAALPLVSCSALAASRNISTASLLGATPRWTSHAML
jgi:hypothetical protein